MSDLTMLRPQPFPDPPGPPSAEEISRLLTGRTARIARILANVVEQLGSADAGAGRTASFLRDWADSTVPAAPIAGQPFDRLAGYFALSPAERDLLLLAGLAEEHEGLGGTFRALHPYGDARPTAGLAALVLAGGTSRARLRQLLGSGAAVRHGLLQLTGAGGLFERSLVPADALWEALHGIDVLPARLTGVSTTGQDAGLGSWLDTPSARRAAACLASGEPVTILVTHPDETAVLSRCAALAGYVGTRLLAARLPASSTPDLALLTAHAAVRGDVPMVLAQDAAAGTGPAMLALRQVPGPVVVLARSGSVRLDPDRPVAELRIGAVPQADREIAWRAAFSGLGQAAAATLAARHPVDPVVIAQAGLDAQADAQAGLVDESAVTLADARTVAGLIRRRAQLSLPPGVQLTTPKVAWSRLVLPARSADQLQDAVSRLEQQAIVLEGWGMRDRAGASGGVRLLFTGPPGTGKTMAAQAVATAAGADLLRVDISQTVSKWIGETEKNLGAAFDAAERTQAVLFVDEADALFGTRTQISDAHDRYANLETAYLLQRLDDFTGITVLATNLRHNIDPAFARRMDFVVEFPLPDESGRRSLWELHLPADRIAADADVPTLARLYAVPGGWIRNAAVAAAFVAATAGQPIGQAHLVAAVRREYDKAAVPFPGEPPRRRDDA